MGIQGLLPLLKSIHKPKHLRDFSGQCIGVDAYGWLHRGTVACAVDLVLGTPTRKHIDFALNRVRMLLHYGVKPYLVFDGDYLPSKEHTELERQEKRRESKRLGMELLRMDKKTPAYLELQKAVDVTPVMARQLIEELKKLGVSYVVAPYEADSQLVYLEKKGIISAILSEDSDMLVFGARCLLTKLDQHAECVMVRQDDFVGCREISLVGWSPAEFRMMTILSGCDYLPGIGGMGLKTAYRLVRRHKTIDRTIRAVQFDGKMKVPAGYLEAFTKAERTFLYQWVFCPEQQCLVNLNKVPEELKVADMEYIGAEVIENLAVGVAVGDLHPHTKRAIELPSTTVQRVVSTPVGKNGVPIDQYFRRSSTRKILGELDPNAQQYSPSQQQLLHDQQNTSWQQVNARPASSPRVAGLQHSAPPSFRRSVSNESPLPRPPHSVRARFCAEPTSAKEDNAQVGTSTKSRFFGPKAAATPASKKTSSKKDDFDLWSDASDEAAMAMACTQVENETATKSQRTSKKRKQMTVYDESSEEQTTAGGDTSEESQISIASIESTTSAAFSTTTSNTSFSREESPAAVTLGRGADSEYSYFKSKFGFKIGNPVKKHKFEHVEAMGQKTEEVVADAEPTDSTAEAEPTDTIEDGEAVDDGLVPCSSSPEAPETLGDVEPETTSFIKRWTAAKEAGLSVHNGSEDQLVPESPSNSGGEDNVEEEAQGAKLDLQRFRFGGV